MSIDLWIAYCVTSFLITISPGPIVLFAIQSVQTHGLSASVLLIPAVILGDATAMALSLSGLGVLLEAVPSLATAVKVLGATFLIWIGMQGLRKSNIDIDQLPQVGSRSLFLTAFGLAALHPGAFVFYAAFFPQFLVLEDNIFIQATLLGVVFLTIAALTLSLWMVSAAVMMSSLAQWPIQAHLARISGLLMIAVGVISAVAALRNTF
ncbi:MAG: LysE family translocator [Parasphingorhabdus sp.]|uniref:LysE family translocator n=1 Tax=Parasphingorhabdus sp. TaxID=2709688 RepID=UPI0032975B3C